MRFTPAELAACIDHSLLRADATEEDVERLCAEARDRSFCAVCVNTSYVELAARLLADTEVLVASTVGFPLGAVHMDLKVSETEMAVVFGAQEIDVAMNVGRLKHGEFRYVRDELSEVVTAADEATVKVILETCLLTDEEKATACKLAVDAGAHFVKTSTGFGRDGARVEDVRLMRACVGPDFGVKAAGGIRDLATALAMLEAGANRIGTSAGVAILQDLAAPPRSP
jgi:deoxyribose-phosphate aldolase